MKFIICFIVAGVSLLIGACPLWKDEIDIGDYDNQLKAWNKQNLLDYKLGLSYDDTHNKNNSKRAVVIVRNGIPESSDPPEWLISGEIATVPKIYSFIKKMANASVSIYVKYYTRHHYPTSIDGPQGGGFQNTERQWCWSFLITPLEENIEETWNSQNILDYQLALYNSTKNGNREALVTVKNGIPESSAPPEWLTSGEMATVPEFFSFIKEEEKIWGEEERIWGDDFPFSKGNLMVNYDIVYNYPYRIDTPDYIWILDLILPGETE